MTREEYVNRINELKADYQQKMDALHQQFAQENNPFKAGDVIKDHIGRIKIERIECYVSHFYQAPMCMYSGPEINKDGSLKKKKGKRTVYQCNVKPCTS